MTIADIELDPAQVAAEPTPIHRESLRAINRREVTATFEAAFADVLTACSHCHAKADEPCVTKSGRVLGEWHVARRQG